VLWTISQTGMAFTAGTSTATSSATTVTPGAVNVKGAWAELVASTSHDTHGITFGQRVAVSTNAMLFDIGVGGSGSERVIVPNLAAGRNDGTLEHWLPVFIPAGSRIAIRVQNSITSTSSSVELGLQYAPNLPTFARATDYGTVTGSSAGTGLYTGTLASNTKSVWTELVAATTHPIKFCELMMSFTSSGTLTQNLVDLGVGPAGSEVVVMPNALFRTASTSMYAPFMGMFLNLPAGVRLAARWQSSSANPGVGPAVSVMGLD